MKFKWRNILIVLGLFLAVVLLIDFNRRMEELDRISTKLEAVRAVGTSVMQTQIVLVTQVAYATSDEAVALWAYENKWVRAGEHPIELIPEGDATPTPVTPTTPQAETPPTWRIWWELFFAGD